MYRGLRRANFRAGRTIRPRRRAFAVAGVAVLVTSAIIIATTPGSADTGPLPGVKAPASYLPYIADAAASCPALTPPKVAGQVMAESRFSPTANITSSGGFGLAGLTDVSWYAWRPWLDADRLDPQANFLALAHRLCDQVGRIRVAKLPGDPWTLAVAAYRTNVAAVTEANGVPDAARNYVNRVLRYSAWYALQPEFGGPPPTPPAAGTSTPKSSATGSAVSTPRPSTTSRPGPRSGALFNNSRCLSASAALDGTQLIMTDCDGSAVQHWQQMSDGTIRSVGLCMDAANAGTANYTPVKVATCSGNPAQQFAVDQNNHIYSSYANKCVNIDRAAGVVLFSCLNQNNQIFTFRQQ
jgi:Ricin-type beta-trefoil lectin domain